jgi:hypothetical protein
MARKKAVSMDQQRQRELSWLLCITEGYAANVQHALAVNAYTLDPAALALMDRITQAAEITGQDIRRLMRREM